MCEYHFEASGPEMAAASGAAARRATTGDFVMTKEARIAQVRAQIEEELGSMRQFADMPAAEIEAIAVRITRAIEAHLDPSAPEVPAARDAA
jgi:hypothetical protein